MAELWEILVPCNWNDGKPVRTRHHREWDKRVRRVAGGLTVLKPGVGQWEHEGELFKNRVIPVRIQATRDQMKQVADMTIQHYEQLAVMYYLVSDTCIIQQATDAQKEAFVRQVVPTEKQETAYCDQCGWEGLAADLKPDPRDSLGELCPECGSGDTWWGKPEEEN